MESSQRRQTRESNIRDNKKDNFDVILLDLAMPEFGGFDIFAALKSEHLLKSKNILVFTASSVTDKAVEEMLASGAKGVFRNPISMDDLIEAVDRSR
ncbi:MAG: response regulator [Thermoproteota archaeon]|nr:response regulator [Thermoproteota archaeon]